jgi:hypothetical protein
LSSPIAGRNHHIVYSDVTYREHGLNIPIAQIVESVASATLAKQDARSITRKFHDVIPAGEDRKLIPSVWQVCYAYDGKITPDLSTIKEAYEIIKEERDSNMLSVNGESFNVKELAQKKRIKERVYQNIQSHSKRITVSVEENRQIGLLLRLLRRLGYNVPDEKKKLLISWEGE